MNGFEVQSEADAMLERQERDVLSKLNNNNAKTPSSRYLSLQWFEVFSYKKVYVKKRIHIFTLIINNLNFTQKDIPKFTKKVAPGNFYLLSL